MSQILCGGRDEGRGERRDGGEVEVSGASDGLIQFRDDADIAYKQHTRYGLSCTPTPTPRPDGYQWKEEENYGINN